jgi:hypothetical protein
MTTAAVEGSVTASAPSLIALDRPTFVAAVASLLFTVGAGALLGMLPANGPLAGALDAVKNLTYVLSIPVFDIARRLLLRRQMRRTHSEPVSASRNIFFVVFVSALLLFVVTEVASFLMGYGMGWLCGGIAAEWNNVNTGLCFQGGIQIMSFVIIFPLMLAIGVACGWIWFRLLRGRFWLSLLMCALVIAVLFSIDLVWALNSLQHEMLMPMIDQLRSTGMVLQVGKQVVVLAAAILIGYATAAFWNRITRWIV